MSKTENNIKFLDNLLNNHPVLGFPKTRSVDEYIRAEKEYLLPALEMTNFCTHVQQIFINELIRGYSEVNGRKINYMEIGLYYGASLVSAMANNTDYLNKVIANDFFEWHDNSVQKFIRSFLKAFNEISGKDYTLENKGEIFTGYKDFVYNLSSQRIIPIVAPIDLTVVAGDCWEKKNDILNMWGNEKVDIYYYDGDHSQKAQKDAVIEFIPCYADEFIYMVDDYTNSGVQDGTREGIEHLTNNGYDLLYEINTMDRWEGHIHEKDGWGDGWYISYLKKNKER